MWVDRGWLCSNTSLTPVSSSPSASLAHKRLFQPENVSSISKNQPGSLTATSSSLWYHLLRVYQLDTRTNRYTDSSTPKGRKTCLFYWDHAVGKHSGNILKGTCTQATIRYGETSSKRRLAPHYPKCGLEERDKRLELAKLLSAYATALMISSLILCSSTTINSYLS